MRGVTLQFGSARALVNRVRRLAAGRAPRVHDIWCEPDEPIEPKRDARIASGRASPNDRFVRWSWESAQDHPPSTPPTANAADVQS
jgi:hypothetical protein